MVNNPLPPLICDFLRRHHVVSLACSNNANLWTANCFYVFDEQTMRLIILTSSTTQHGTMMKDFPSIVGTIAKQTEQISEIEGIQFRAMAYLLNEQEKEQALTLYYQRHPQTKTFQSEVWEIRFEYIKHTQNRQRFAQKSEWYR